MSSNSTSPIQATETLAMNVIVVGGGVKVARISGIYNLLPLGRRLLTVASAVHNIIVLRVPGQVGGGGKSSTVNQLNFAARKFRGFPIRICSIKYNLLP